MKVVILGAGQVGSSVAENLVSEANDITIVDINPERLKKLQQGPIGSVGHACEFETSILLAIAPELVDMSLAEDGGIQHRAQSMWFDMLHGPAATCYRPFDILSENGAFGKPSLASVEKGRQILDEVTAALHELIGDFWPNCVEPNG